MSDTLIKLLEKQHKETVELSKESIRLLELYSVEQQITHVKTGMLDQTLKKVLVSITDFGETAKALLKEFK